MNDEGLNDNPAAALADYLVAAPQGTCVWVRGLGRSMWPLLNDGDGLEVQSCDEAALRRGHIALTCDAQGALTAHLVVAVRPLRTTAFLGAEDEDPGQVLGRAVTLERKGVQVPLRFGLRRALFLLFMGARVGQRVWRLRKAI